MKFENEPVINEFSPAKSILPKYRVAHLMLCACLLGLTLSACKLKKDSPSKTPILSDGSMEVLIQAAAEDSSGELDPIANPDARSGGTLTLWASEFPASLNMWLDYNSFSKSIIDLMFESLVSLHPARNEAIGILAKSWEISDDKKTYTFHLDPKGKWSDGKAITAEDVQFYYDVIMDKKNLTSLFRVGLDRFERPKVIDSLTLSITAKSSHWSNFWEAGGLSAFPKHIWADKNFNDVNNEFPVVSGPYQLDKVIQNRSVSLKRREDWWGRSRKINLYKYNFDQIQYKFMNDQFKALEAFKKGDYDVLSIYRSSIWMEKTNFEAVEKGWVARQKIFNKEPIGFQGMAFNLRQEKFQDIRVREALSHLLNRKLMNEKLMFNQYFMLNSYYPDLWPDNQNPNVAQVEFDPDKARQLLAEAGWKVNAAGKLEKAGKIFEINFMTGNPDLTHMNVYMEDLKAVGIVPRIEQVSMASIRKRLDKHDFDMYWMAWGASRLRDPEASWHTKTAMELSTNNIPGVKDAGVDSLIELQKNEFDVAKRDLILQALDTRLAKLMPYALLWQNDHKRLLSWRKFGTPASVLDKYNGEDAIPVYWYFDEKKAKDLTEAKKNNAALNKPSEEVHYSE